MLKSDIQTKMGLKEVDELEDLIDKLRLNFEQFFSGVGNIDPSDKKMQIRRVISRLNQMRLKNPRVRFRFQSLVGRFISMDQYWIRTMREIEEGRLTRGLFYKTVKRSDTPKAYFSKETPKMSDDDQQRKNGDVAVPSVQDKTKRKDIRSRKIEESDLKNINQKRSLQGPDAAARSSNKQSATSDFDEKKLDRIHDEFITARKNNNAATANIKKETLKKQINNQYKVLKQKYKDASIDFRVVEKDGKVILKPVVKKSVKK